MTSEQQPTPHDINRQELGEDAVLYEGQEPKQVSYDASDIPKITAEQLDTIENTIYAISDPEVAEAKLVELLAGYGIDSSKRDNGMMVVELTGVDGKTVVRPIVASAHDFGTVARNVEMIPQAQEPVQGTEEAVADFKLPDLRVDATPASVDGDTQVRPVLPDLRVSPEEMAAYHAPIDDSAPSEHGVEAVKALEDAEPTPVEEESDEEAEEATAEYERMKTAFEEQFNHATHMLKSQFQTRAERSAAVNVKLREVIDRLEHIRVRAQHANALNDILADINELTYNILPLLRGGMNEEAEMTRTISNASQQAGEKINEARSHSARLEKAERDMEFEHMLVQKDRILQEFRRYLGTHDESEQATKATEAILQRTINGEYGIAHVPAVIQGIKTKLEELYGHRLNVSEVQRGTLEELAK